MTRKKKREKWYKRIARGAKKAQGHIREFHTGVQTIAGSLEPPDFENMFGEPSIPKPRRIIKKSRKRKRPRKVVTEYY